VGETTQLRSVRFRGSRGLICQEAGVAVPLSFRAGSRWNFTNRIRYSEGVVLDGSATRSDGCRTSP